MNKARSYFFHTTLRNLAFQNTDAFLQGIQSMEGREELRARIWATFQEDPKARKLGPEDFFEGDIDFRQRTHEGQLFAMVGLRELGAAPEDPLWAQACIGFYGVDDTTFYSVMGPYPEKGGEPEYTIWERKGPKSFIQLAMALSDDDDALFDRMMDPEDRLPFPQDELFEPLEPAHSATIVIPNEQLEKTPIPVFCPVCGTEVVTRRKRGKYCTHVLYVNINQEVFLHASKAFKGMLEDNEVTLEELGSSMFAVEGLELPRNVLNLTFSVDEPISSFDVFVGFQWPG